MSTSSHFIEKNTADIIRSYSSVKRKFSALEMRTVLIGGGTFKNLSETSDEV
jgi:hypothetical protein